MITYKDVSFILDDVTIWCDGYEQYWYQKAWSVLEHQGVTEFSTDREYYRVLLYAFALVHVYDEFCGIAFDENHETDFRDYMYDDLSPLVLGQILSDYLDDGEIIEEEEEAISLILNNLKYEVFRTIKAELSATDVFMWMYCTAANPFEDAMPLDDEEEEEELFISCYDDYCQMVKKATEEPFEAVSGSQVEAFDYVCSLM